jgi:hypothetical protein
MAAHLRLVAVSLLVSSVALGWAWADEAPSHTPDIDCPLAKHGIHPGDLRPFKDVEKYVAFLGVGPA